MASVCQQAVKEAIKQSLGACNRTAIGDESAGDPRGIYLIDFRSKFLCP